MTGIVNRKGKINIVYQEIQHLESSVIKDETNRGGGRERRKREGVGEALLALIASTDRIEDDALGSARLSLPPFVIVRDRCFARRLSFNIPTQKNIRKRKCHTFSFGRCLSRRACPRSNAPRWSSAGCPAPKAMPPQVQIDIDPQRMNVIVCAMLRRKIENSWKYQATICNPIIGDKYMYILGDKYISPNNKLLFALALYFGVFSIFRECERKDFQAVPT